MKPTTFDITPKLVEHYCEEHTTPPSEQLYGLERWVHLHTAYPRMASGHFQGRLLTMLTQMQRPMLAVEVGTFVGYAAICIGEGLPEKGVLHTIEVNDEWERVIKDNIAQAQLCSKVALHIGNAHDIIPLLPDDIDMAYIDADKPSTPDYYELLLPKMRRGGIVLIDNILWSGKVLRPDLNPDADTRILDTFNNRVQADERVENILLPFRDGIMMCRVK